MTDTLTESIKSKLKREFERNLLDASLKGLEDLVNPIRYSNFAFSFRELIRHILSNLSPDDEVLNCQWYKNETSKDNGISRRQRMLYAIKGGLSDEFIRDELNFDLDIISNKMKKVIDNLNKYTHVEPETFDIAAELVDKMVFNSLLALDEFLITIELLRNEIISVYEAHLSKLINEVMISDTIQEIDVIATHYLVEDCLVESISINSIDNSEVIISINGSVYVEHQYGSDGDYRRGDGLMIKDSYPFSGLINVDVKTPVEIDINLEDIKIDTSLFYI